MAELPVLFTEYTRQLMGEERFERYLQSFEEDAPVSIRLNPRKSGEWKVESGEFSVLRFPLSTTFSSTQVFHSPQAGHFPNHFGDSLPHDLQKNTLFSFAPITFIF